MSNKLENFIGIQKHAGKNQKMPYLIGHETGLHHVLQGGEALLDGRGDGPEDQDQGQVHVSQQRSSQHSGVFVKTVNKTGY